MKMEFMILFYFFEDALISIEIKIEYDSEQLVVCCRNCRGHIPPNV